MPVVGTIHFIRHGDTEASGDGVFCGDLDIPLAPSGMAQAAALAGVVGKWKIEAVYVSPKLRARMTSEPACRALGLTAHVEEGLREIGYGTWEGRHESEIRASDPLAYAAWTGDPGTRSPPGGESGFTIAARAMPIVARIAESHAGGEVVVFSHKATIRIITCALLGVPISRFRDRIACPTASITTFTFSAHGPLLTRLGETAEGVLAGGSRRFELPAGVRRQGRVRPEAKTSTARCSQRALDGHRMRRTVDRSIVAMIPIGNPADASQIFFASLASSSGLDVSVIIPCHPAMLTSG